MEAEVLPQITDQLEVLARRLIQDKTGVVISGRHIFTTPQASRREVDPLHTPISTWKLEPQFKIGIDQQRQLADQHQPPLGYVAQIPHDLVRESVEYFQKTRQLVTLDAALDNHVEFHCVRPFYTAVLTPQIPWSEPEFGITVGRVTRKILPTEHSDFSCLMKYRSNAWKA